MNASKSYSPVPPRQWEPNKAAVRSCQCCGRAVNRSGGVLSSLFGPGSSSAGGGGPDAATGDGGCDYCRCCGRVCCADCLGRCARVVLYPFTEHVSSGAGASDGGSGGGNGVPASANKGVVSVCEACFRGVLKAYGDSEIALEKNRILEGLLNDENLENQKLRGNLDARLLEAEEARAGQQRAAAAAEAAEARARDLAVRLEVASAQLDVLKNSPGLAAAVGGDGGSAAAEAEARVAAAEAELEERRRTLDLREATLQGALKKVSADAARLSQERAAAQEREKAARAAAFAELSEGFFAGERQRVQQLYLAAVQQLEQDGARLREETLGRSADALKRTYEGELRRARAEAERRAAERDELARQLKAATEAASAAAPEAAGAAAGQRAADDLLVLQTSMDALKRSLSAERAAGDELRAQLARAQETAAAQAARVAELEAAAAQTQTQTQTHTAADEAQAQEVRAWQEAAAKKDNEIQRMRQMVDDINDELADLLQHEGAAHDEEEEGGRQAPAGGTSAEIYTLHARVGRVANMQAAHAAAVAQLKAERDALAGKLEAAAAQASAGETAAARLEAAEGQRAAAETRAAEAEAKAAALRAAHAEEAARQQQQGRAAVLAAGALLTEHVERANRTFAFFRKNHLDLFGELLAGARAPAPAPAPAAPAALEAEERREEQQKKAAAARRARKEAEERAERLAAENAGLKRSLREATGQLEAARAAAKPARPSAGGNQAAARALQQEVEALRAEAAAKEARLRELQQQLEQRQPDADTEALRRQLLAMQAGMQERLQQLREREAAVETRDADCAARKAKIENICRQLALVVNKIKETSAAGGGGGTAAFAGALDRLVNQFDQGQ